VDKKEQIMNGAMKLFVEQDVQATPMSAIAKEAKTGMGTIYNYFATKEELINSIFIYIKTDQQEKISQSVEGISVRKQFEHYYLGYNQYWLTYPLHFKFVDQFERSPILSQVTKEQGMSIIQPIVNLLLQGQQQGVIKAISVDELVQFLNGGIHGFIRWALTVKTKSAAELLHNQLKMAWDAIKE
jgi:AcrR family transcriptional regulator